MPCYKPLDAYQAPSGKIRFKIEHPFTKFIRVPCGQCIGCRLEYSRQWSIRIMHEASLYPQNTFITLTYDDDHLPQDHSLDKTHFQKFMKRLRKKYADRRIRFYHCGEYGSQLSRPHYHAILFNFDFPDKTFWKQHNGENYYLSDSLARLWGKGYVTIGEVTHESAAYVARYCTKKITGSLADSHYFTVDKYGELHDGLQPEYATMSRMPGIGRGFYEQYANSIYPHDECVIIRKNKAVSMKPPRYYDSLYAVDDPEDYLRLKSDRVALSSKNVRDNKRVRLSAREKCKRKQIQTLIRPYEVSA